VIRGIDWLLEKFKPLVTRGMRLLQKGKQKLIGAGKAVVQVGVPKDPNERLRLAAEASVAAARRLSGRVTKALLNPVLAGIRVRYGLAAIQPYEQSGTWWVRATINPTLDQDLGVPSEEIGKPKEVKPSATVTPVAVNAWIKNKDKDSYEQVTSSSNVIRRTAAGVVPISFATAPADGGTNTLLYSDEDKKWERTNLSHGSRHAVPVGGGKFELRISERGSTFIRPTFYADTANSRSTIVQAKLPSLLNPSNSKEFLSEGSPSAEFAKGYRLDASTGKALVPVSDASPDHDPAIAEHWNKKGGNNTDQTQRMNWNTNLATYKIMSLRLNLSLGGRGEYYTELVGINFRGPGE
jgi:hypothetical protein